MAAAGGERSEGLPVPGQEFGDAASWVVGDAGEPIGEIVLRVEAVELGALDQRVEGRGAAAAGIGAGKQIIFAANSDTTQGPLGGIVVGRRPAVVEATHQARSSAPAYSGRPGRARICARAGAGCSRPKRPMPRQSALTAAGAAVVAARVVIR